MGRLSKSLYALLLISAAILQSDAFIPKADCVQMMDHYFLGSKAIKPSSLEECRAGCLANNNCVGFEYDISANNCSSFMGILDDSDGGPGYAARMNLTAYRCRPHLDQENADYPGNDLQNVPAANPSMCSYLCDQTKKCNAYSWTNYNGGTCWMKREKPDAGVPTNGDVISGESFKGFALLFDRDIPNGNNSKDVGSAQRSIWGECLGVCRRNKECDAFTWTDFNGGTCWLKSVPSGLIRPVKKVGAVSMGVDRSRT